MYHAAASARTERRCSYYRHKHETVDGIAQSASAGQASGIDHLEVRSVRYSRWHRLKGRMVGATAGSQSARQVLRS